MLLRLREKMKRKEGQKGFTLIELIVVMAILAVLAALAVPRISTVLTTSKYKAHNNNLDLIAKAAELYYDNQDAIPGSMASLVNNTYLKTLPNMPHNAISTGNYSLSSTANGVVIAPGSCSFNGVSVSSQASTAFTF